MMTLFLGGNAQGKTNLLEAVYYLSCAKSHRTHLDDEMVRHGEDGFYLKADFEVRNQKTCVEIVNRPGGRKRIKIDGKYQTKLSSLIGYTHVVLFSPESLSLVKGGPSDRRRFLDGIIAHLDPVYLRALQTYMEVLKQRNELLKMIRDRQATSDLLEPWEAQLIPLVEQIVKIRTHFSQKLGNIAALNMGALTQEQEQLGVEYLPSAADASEYVAKLNRSRTYDLMRGTTSVGPHRDEMLLTIGDDEAKRYGSQGQQRTLTLALKLAELELTRQITGEAPLVLLDDVASELDEHRTRFLFKWLLAQNAQVFVTTTDIDHLKLDASAFQVLRVQNGDIVH